MIEKPDLLLATPLDPLFLILPALAAEGVEERGKQMFLSTSHYLDRLEEASPHFRRLMRGGEQVQKNVEAMFEARIAAVCESMDIGDGEMLYRLSVPKLLGVLVEKARRIVDGVLFPSSMEEKFVRQALVVPVLSVRREESGVSIAEQDQQAGAERGSEIASEASTSQQDSQASSVMTTTSVSTATTSISSSQQDSLPPTETKDKENQIPHLLRLRTTLTYLLTSYIPPPLQTPLTTALSSSPSSPPPINFEPLTKHLTHLTTLRAEAQTLRSLSDNISRKRSAIDEDDEEAREKAEVKKRKKEEEEIRRKNVSRGVKALEKVDRSGMKTLSAFFGAAGAGGKGGGGRKG